MPTLTIHIDDATAARLQTLAQERGSTPEREVERAVTEHTQSADEAALRRKAMLENADDFMTSHADDFRRLAS